MKMIGKVLMLGVLFCCFKAEGQGYFDADSLQVNKMKIGIQDNGQNYPGMLVDIDGEPFPTVFRKSLWMEGNNNDSLYGISGWFNDSSITAGPMADQYDSSFYDRYSRVWKVSRQTIEDHRQNWWTSGYTTPQVLLDWPAHGDTTNGEAYELAPYEDVNGNQQYDPQNGDYPRIRGDKAVFFMFNAMSPSTEDSAKRRMPVEGHGMIYGFDCPLSPPLDYSVFFHYELINRSNLAFDSTYLGDAHDLDMGCSQDDRMGSLVESGAVYSYDMETGMCNGVQNLPYAVSQAAVTLKGPRQDSDGIDNPVGTGPGESLNGIGYGDGVADNEHLGMHRSHYFNIGGGPKGDPKTQEDFYNYLTGSWKDGTSVEYGGNGYFTTSGSISSDPTRFVFPGSSDPQNWSLDSAAQPAWYYDSINPADIRALNISGPFTFQPNDTVTHDMAYVFTMDSTVDDSVIPEAMTQARLQKVRAMFLNDSTPCQGGSFTGVYDEYAAPEGLEEVRVFPNPAEEHISVDVPASLAGLSYRLFDMMGRTMKGGRLRRGSTWSIGLKDLESAVYFLELRSKGGRREVVKVVKE